MKKLFSTFLASGVILCFLLPQSVKGGDDPLNNLAARQVTMPYYKNGILQFLLFSGAMNRNGEIIIADDPVLNIMRKNADIKLVNSDVPTIYEIFDDLEIKRRFWETYSQSDAILASDKANINQTTRNIRGSSKIFIRTPQLDLNGFDYEAIYDKQTLTIDRDVLISYHSTEDTAKNSNDKKPSQNLNFTNVKASGESLFINYKSGEIVLKGNVEVDDPKFNLKCGRINIYLDNSSDAAVESDEESRVGAFSSKVKVKNLVCLENVQITIKDQTPEQLTNKEAKTQRAVADKATFDMDNDLIILEEGNPTVFMGEDSVHGKKITINQKSEEFLVERDCVVTVNNMSASGKSVENDKKGDQKKSPTVLTCDFIDFKYGKNVGYFNGSVKINDSQMYLTGDKMTVYLFDKNPSDSLGAVKNSNPAELNPLGGGNKGVKEVVFDGNVSVCQKDEKGNVDVSKQAQSGKLHYNMIDEIITLTEDNPIITYNTESIAGDEIVIYPKNEQMALAKGVEIKSYDKDGGVVSSSINARQGNLNYGGNKLIFVGDVKVRNSQLNADSGKMTIYLKESENSIEKSGTNEATQAAANEDMFSSMMSQSNSSKRLERIVFIQDAKLNDVKGDIYSDKITVLFRPAQSESEDLKVGDAELERFICDGNFKFVSSSKEPDAASGEKVAAPTTMEADFADINLVTNIGDFIGNVKIEDELNSLTCDKMVAHGKMIPRGEAIDNSKQISSAVDVPDRINLAAGRELDKIDCFDNVVVTRTEEGSLPMKAIGDFARYPVKDKKIFMEQRKNRPRIYRGPNWVDGDIIIVHLDNGEVEIKDFTSEVEDGNKL